MRYARKIFINELRCLQGLHFIVGASQSNLSGVSHNYNNVFRCKHMFPTAFAMKNRSSRGAVVSMLTLQSRGHWFDPRSFRLSDETLNLGPISMA